MMVALKFQPTPFSAWLIKSKGGLSVDEQKEVLPPDVMRCFDRTEGGTHAREKAPYASNSFAATKLPGISKRKEGPVGGRAFCIARGGNTLSVWVSAKYAACRSR